MAIQKREWTAALRSQWRKYVIARSETTWQSTKRDRMKIGYVYILSNQPNGTLYIGVTSDLVKRIWEHKNEVAA